MLERELPRPISVLLGELTLLRAAFAAQNYAAGVVYADVHASRHIGGAALLEHLANLFTGPYAIDADNRRRKQLANLLLSYFGPSVSRAKGLRLLYPRPELFFINLAGFISTRNTFDILQQPEGGCPNSPTLLRILHTPLGGIFATIFPPINQCKG